jgi:hypothetical protein
VSEGGGTGVLGGLFVFLLLLFRIHVQAIGHATWWMASTTPISVRATKNASQAGLSAASSPTSRKAAPATDRAGLTAANVQRFLDS